MTGWNDSTRLADPRSLKGSPVALTLVRPLLLGALTVLFVPATADAQAPTAFPRFERTLLLETSSETSANVSIGDVNGDGHPDLVLAKGRHWPLVDRVLLGDGRGGFSAGYDLGTASDRTYTGQLVDIDGDGDLDVVISNDNPDPGLVYRNDGTGRFSVGSTFGAAEWNTRNATVADLNGDGLPDIVVANRSGPNPGASYICLNQGGGKFGAECILFARESATTITAADLNGDGRLDLVVPHRDGGQGHLYIQDGAAGELRFTAVPFGPANATMRVSSVADFDRDGILDIATSDERRGVVIYYGEGANRYGEGVALGSSDLVPYALVAGDVNLDGAIDIVVGYIEAPSAVHFNLGAGRRFEATRFGNGAGSVYGLAIGDLNGDGRPDIAAARSEAPNVVYFATPARPER